MINIEKTQVITYGNNQTVTVYRDFSDSNKWYVVPEPVIPLNDDGVPEFALVQYNADGGKTAGTCTFQTELAVSPEALTAVKAKLGSGITIGQFDWQSVRVLFTFSTASQAAMQLSATPSMYGANRASFVIHLPDQTTINDFKNAFSPQGSASGTFMLEYDVTALTQLPPATVTVSFNANTAYQYQRTVRVSKNVWGHVTSRSVTIHEHLSQSEAGTITVGPGNLDAKLKQKLEDWGNATLERDVDRAVAQAMKIIGSNNSDSFSMSSVASFKDEYVEGQIVPWVITPRAPIPAFTAGNWDKVFSTVPNQTLSVAFTVQNLQAHAVGSIELTVLYPTRQTENTVEFKPDTAGSWVFSAPGNVVNGAYDPSYKYQYTVHYTDGSQPYKSPQIESSETAVYINAADLNVLEVTFDAANVAFSGGESAMPVSADNKVDYLLVDFYFVNEADGNLVQSQQKRLDGTNHSKTFSSRTKLPFKNDYHYKLTYVMTGGQQVVIDWQTGNVATVASGDHASVPVVTLSSPFQTATVMVNPIAPASSKYDMIQLMVRYSDKVNKLNEQHVWQIQGDKIPEMWNFLAPANKNGQEISFQGEYIVAGQQHMVQPAKTSSAFVNISTTQETFSVVVDPSQIEWADGPITQVVVNVYTKTADGNKTDISSPVFLAEKSDSVLYDFLFATGQTPTYYYTAQYWIKGNAKPNVISEKKVEGKGVLTLPGKAS